MDEEEGSSTDNESKINENVHLSVKLYADMKQKVTLFRVLMKRLQHNGVLVTKLRIVVEDLKAQIRDRQKELPEKYITLFMTFWKQGKNSSDQKFSPPLFEVLAIKLDESLRIPQLPIDIPQLKRKFHSKRRELRQIEVTIRDLLRRQYQLATEISLLENRRREYSSPSKNNENQKVTTKGASFLMIELKPCNNGSFNDTPKFVKAENSSNFSNDNSREPESLIDAAVKRQNCSDVKGVEGLDDESIEDEHLRGFPSSMSENLHILKSAISEGKFTRRKKKRCRSKRYCELTPEKTLHDKNL